MAVQTLKKVFRFYVDGFRSMTVGKTLWAIILVKLFRKLELEKAGRDAQKAQKA